MSKIPPVILQCLHLGARLNLKTDALEYVFSLTETSEGVGAIVAVPELMASLVALLKDSSPSIAHKAALCLLNVSADSHKAAEALLSLDMLKFTQPLQKAPDNIIATCVWFILDCPSSHSDICCSIFANITRHHSLNDKCIELFEATGHTFDYLFTAFSCNNYNKNGATLHALGTILPNITQSLKVRRYIMDKEKCLIRHLLPFVDYKESLDLRRGVVGALRNCCFDSEYHEWLLSDEVEILPHIVLPLAGGEQFDDEDSDKLPLDLQFLPEHKQREEDPEIRCMLIEAITQLCRLRKNREVIRSQNIYVVLREHHKWEPDLKAKLACENLVDILIRYESEIKEDDLKSLEVPEDLVQKFHRMDMDYLNDQ